MGRKRKAVAGEAAATGGDIKRFRRALRSLDVVDSRLDFKSWSERVARLVGEDRVEEFDALPPGDYESSYNFSYQSFEHALHFSVGWRSDPLRLECEWMIPRLRDALDRSDSSNPFLVEIGAGPGAASALISAALNVPVIAIDAHPASEGLAEQFAERTRGVVESRVGDMKDLEHQLRGDRPSAVFGMGIYKHFQPPQQVGDSFSYWADMKRAAAAYRAEADVEAFIAALNGCDLLLSETAGVVHLAEIAAGLAAHGYVIPREGLAEIEAATPPGPQTAHTMQFTTAELPTRDPNLLIELYRPLPTARPLLQITGDDVRAEAMRLSLEPTELVGATEWTYSDGSGVHRHEVFLKDGVAGHYQATTRGFREIRFVGSGNVDELVYGVRERASAMMVGGQLTAREINTPAPMWGTGFDA
ncbi:MAG: hypothetical protein ACKOI2_10905 [Actinomycetota bacterium]